MRRVSGATGERTDTVRKGLGSRTIRLVPKQQPITYIVDSLSLVLRPRPRFYPVFGSEWTQVGPKFSRCEFTRITLRKPENRW